MSRAHDFIKEYNAMVRVDLAEVKEKQKKAGGVQGEWKDGKVRSKGRTKGITRGAK